MARYTGVTQILHDLASTVRDTASQMASRLGLTRAEEELHKINTVVKLCGKVIIGSIGENYAWVKDLCTRILDHDPGNELAEEALSFVQAREREATRLYQYIDAHSDDSDLSDLYVKLADARANYPDHPLEASVGARLEERRNRFYRTMDRGFSCVNRGAKRQALDVFREAYRINPGYSDLPTMIRELEDDVYRGKTISPLW